MPMHDDSSGTLVSVRVDGERTRRFSGPFIVGRAAECDVQVDDHHVSRTHLRVAMAGGRWTFTDLQSSNGVFVDGRRVTSGAIHEHLTLRLGGEDGPALALTVEREDASRPAAVANAADRYFGNHDPDEPAGPRTMMIRQAYQQVQRRQKRRYLYVVSALALVGLGALAYAWHVQGRLDTQTARAAEFFYLLKEIDVRIAAAEQAMAAAGRTMDDTEARANREQRRAAEAKYEQFLEGLDIYGRPLTEQEKLILKVTRVFGECELIVPRDYITRVQGYIDGWRRTKRFANAVRLARERGYVRHIVEEFERQNLPPQFFYLAMQESDFNARAIGPPTRYGHAKGMWQFIADTGGRFGLALGPGAKSNVYEPSDERFQWQKATTAAARYIKEIYATDAQASGLLVMASYNWGERRVVNFIRTLPENPRDRNFWLLLRDHGDKVPSETYKYVFSIVSAAVIGENPRLFGFDFDNPIEEVLGSTRDATAVTRQHVPQIVVNASR